MSAAIFRVPHLCFRGSIATPRRHFARGASGKGWFRKYEKEGPKGFEKFKPPTPFDWDANAGKTSRAFFEIHIDGESRGRIEFELLEELLPTTTTNFKRLCTGTNPAGFSYIDSPIHHIVKNASIVGGDVEFQTGNGSHSAMGSRYFKDEALILCHAQAGIISMVNGGVDTNGSQFYITTAPCPHLDGYCVAFGRVTSGMEVVYEVSDLFSIRGKPVAEVLVKDCGVL